MFICYFFDSIFYNFIVILYSVFYSEKNYFRLTEDQIQKRVDEYRQELQQKMEKALENRKEFIDEILQSKG